MKVVAAVAVAEHVEEAVDETDGAEEVGVEEFGVDWAFAEISDAEKLGAELAVDDEVEGVVETESGIEMSAVDAVEGISAGTYDLGADAAENGSYEEDAAGTGGAMILVGVDGSY